MTDGKTVRNWRYPQPITIELGLILMSSSIFVITPVILNERKKHTFLAVRAKALNIFLQLDSCSWNQPESFSFKGYF